MYGVAEAKYFKRSHEDKWRKARPGMTPYRIYAKGNLKMVSEAAALEVSSKLQPYVSEMFNSDDEEIIDDSDWTDYGIGEIIVGASKDGFLQVGACFMQAEENIIEALEIESLNDLSGYKELWTLLEDLDQKATLEA
jgi:hypothetical protein